MGQSKVTICTFVPVLSVYGSVYNDVADEIDDEGEGNLESSSDWDSISERSDGRAEIVE